MKKKATAVVSLLIGVLAFIEQIHATPQQHDQPVICDSCDQSRMRIASSIGGGCFRKPVLRLAPQQKEVASIHLHGEF
jgi:hypothetical protein